jgi:intron-binding protein aquarius
LFVCADIILSLTRTTRVGYLRDIRRLTVALSRARLGLYILGRRGVFEACYELRDAFELLLRRPDKLELVTGELWPSERLLTPQPPAADGTAADGEGGGIGEVVGPSSAGLGEAVMEGVEHLGQYVFEMTSTRVKQLREERGLGGEVPVEEVVQRIEEGYGDLEGREGEEEGGEEGEGTVRGEGFEVEEDA